MERKDIERLIIKRLDGELTAAEQEALERALDADPGARRTAGKFEQLQSIVGEYANSLGEPSECARQRVLGLESPHPRFGLRAWAGAAIAALVLVAFGVGVVVGTAVSRPEEEVGMPIVDTSVLEKAVSETWQFMPSHVRWIALQRGKLQLEASALPLGEEPGEMYFVSFLTQRGKGAPDLLCQLAVLAGEEAQLVWQQHGQWSVQCRPIVTEADRRLRVTISFKPDGDAGQGILLASEPGLTTDRVFSLASLRVREAELNVWAQVHTRRVEELVREKLL